MNDQTTLSRAERQRIQLQAEIIEAAFLEFSERGYHQTAISDIAKRLGIGHGTFYRHFENKRDILDKVIVDTMFKITALLADENAPNAVSTLDDYIAQCERISFKFQEFARENPRTLRLILLEATSIDKEMTAQVSKLLQVGGLFTANYLQNGIDRGYLNKNLNTEMTGHAVVGVIIAGALQFLLANQEAKFLEQYSKAAIQLMIFGVSN